VQPQPPAPAASPVSPSPTAASSPLPYATPDWFKQGVLYEIFVRLRAATPALAEGSFQLLPTDQDSVWAFWRWTGSQVVSAVFNLGTTKVSVALDLSTAPGPVGTRPTDLLSGQPVAGLQNPATLTLGPAQASLLDWSPEG
jgi:glycosidase